MRKVHIPGMILALIQSLLVCFVASPGYGEEASCGKFAGVKKWYGKFTMTVNETSVFEPKGGSIQEIKLFERLVLSASGSFELIQDEEFTNDFRAENAEFVTVGKEETWAEDAEGIDMHVVREIEKLEYNNNHAYLSRLCGPKTYTFAVGVGRLLEKSRIEDPRVCHISGAEKACELAKERYAAEKATFELEARAENQPLDPASPKLSGSALVDTNHLGKGGKPVRAQLTWTLSPTPFSEEVEVTVTPSSQYEKWIPEGNLIQPGQPGNRIGITLQVHKKGDPKALRKATLEVSLKDVSKEKGVCMNSPIKAAMAGADLSLPTTENPAFIALPGAEKEQSMKTKIPVEKAEVMVTSHDFGAYGTLRITGKDTNGQDVHVVILGKDTTDLAIPMDDNHNHIADEWEAKWAGGMDGKEADDTDEKPQAKSSCKGDGLTRYEEYRGFKISGGPEAGAEEKAPLELITGQHVRTDPRVRDLFVCDKTSGKTGGPGIVHFGKSTGLRVHRLAAEEIDSERGININSGEWHSVAQHGILIIDGPKGSDPEQIPMDKKSEDFGPPVTTRYIKLPLGNTYASGDALGDVAHELAHAVGLRHHGDSSDYAAEWYWKMDANGAWKLYEQVMMTGTEPNQWVPNPKWPASPIQVFWEPKKGGGTPRPFAKEDGAPEGSLTVGLDRWRLLVGGKHGWFSGDQYCLMRYADKQAFLSKDNPDDYIRYIPDKSQWVMRDRICDSKEGTGVNEEKHPPISRYGDAEFGNCRGQLVVNDKCLP